MTTRQKTVWLFLLTFLTPPLFAKTWYIRPDGGTRYSRHQPSGQCNGQADAAYPGSGKNRNCAYKDFRSLYDDDSGVTRYDKGEVWVIEGADTVIIRGCSASPNEENPANPDCRIGWDRATGGPRNNQCYYIDGGPYACYNPPIPPGTPSQHTRILGQNYANCSTQGTTNPKQYVGNLSQLFSGFGAIAALNLQNTQYVDIQCIEITTHNGHCTTTGSPASPVPCKTGLPLDDFGQNGISTDHKTSNITLQDIYIHGFNSSGLDGPIGGPITMNRVFVGFNGFAGWNFDDGHNTPDAPGSSISAHYVTMIANGCYEEYPIVHAFPARACYDDNSAGFGDAWSGQDTRLSSFICDHCVMAYNTKDAFIGPHTQIETLTVTDSQSYGNMGAQWKWTNAPGGIVTFINNLTVGNCARYSDINSPIPGAAHSFSSASKQTGGHLSDYCRAAGNVVSISTQQDSHVLIANNTFVASSPTILNINCGPVGPSNGMCGSAQILITNNIFLGYKQNDVAPGLYYMGDSSVKVISKNNIEYGIRNGDSCWARGTFCSDPLLTNEPPQSASQDGNQSFLDNFNFYPRSNSPANGRGIPIKDVTSDFFGARRPNPPTIGALEPALQGNRKTGN